MGGGWWGGWVAFIGWRVGWLVNWLGLWMRVLLDGLVALFVGRLHWWLVVWLGLVPVPFLGGFLVGYLADWWVGFIVGSVGEWVTVIVRSVEELVWFDSQYTEVSFRRVVTMTTYVDVFCSFSESLSVRSWWWWSLWGWASICLWTGFDHSVW